MRNKILIVDDEIYILETLKKLFELKDIDVDICENGKKALELHKKILYPVILTDIMMPEVDGVQFLRKVKAMHPTCIPFVMTGYASMANLIECLEMGAVDYFPKPFKDMAFVIKSVADAVERHERWTKYISIFSRKG